MFESLHIYLLCFAVLLYIVFAIVCVDDPRRKSQHPIIEYEKQIKRTALFAVLILVTIWAALIAYGMGW